MTPDLLRQRRNLILLSGALLLFDFAGVTVAKVSVMGTELVVGNAKALPYFAWSMWCYFLLRYYQYLRAEQDLGIASGIQSFFEGSARAYVHRKLHKALRSGHIEIKRNGIYWGYSVMEYVPSVGGQEEIENGSLPSLRAFWWIVSSVYYVAIHTPKATDHVLPFLLAFAAPIVSAAKALL